jgi:hypothetical protein
MSDCLAAGHGECWGKGVSLRRREVVIEVQVVDKCKLIEVNGSFNKWMRIREEGRGGLVM